MTTKKTWYDPNYLQFTPIAKMSYSGSSPVEVTVNYLEDVDLNSLPTGSVVTAVHGESRVKKGSAITYEIVDGEIK
jgi:hypothetical protein